jgi:hypothetical protein
MYNSSLKWMVLLTIVLTMIASCEKDNDSNQPNDISYGEPVNVGNGKVMSFIQRNSVGNPESIGFHFSEAALDGLPNHNTLFDIPLPADNKTLVNHISFDFTSHGHEPSGVYNIPHFDVHFYLIPQQVQDAITNTGPEIDVVPGSEYWPKDFMPGPGGEPKMGKHWSDTTAEEFHGKPFTQTFIYGSYNGKFVFHEPMIALSYLKGKPNITIPVKQQNIVQESGYYPKSYAIKFDEDNKIYTISLNGLTYKSK